MPFSTTRMVEWGDCDPAGIVYYPNYYRWMDGTFHELAAQCGFSQASLAAEHGLLGTPLVDTGCRFVSPAAQGDRLDVEARLERIGGSSLRLVYRFAIGDRVTAEGFEARVFAVRTPSGGLRTGAIPPAIRAALEASSAAA